MCYGDSDFCLNSLGHMQVIYLLKSFTDDKDLHILRRRLLKYYRREPYLNFTSGDGTASDLHTHNQQ